MDDSKNSPIKPKPYPLDGEMTVSGTKATIKIVHLDQPGFVAYVVSGLCHVGIHYQCTFFLPGSATPILVNGQVFKTYDRVNPKSHAVDRVVEVLFIKMPESDKARIRTFLAAAAGPNE